jgi:CheY-like chemotaxis protein
MQLVLVIENNPASYSELEYILQGHRFRVVITSLNKRMIDYIKSSNPDLIIMGISLENSKEIEFVIGLRKDSLTEGIPVLGLLPREDENFKNNYKILGFTDYITSHDSKNGLIPKVKDIIQEYSSYRKVKSDSSDKHIVILSHGLNTIIYLRSSLSIYVASEIKDILSSSMLRRLKDDTICIDIRGLFDLLVSEIPILQRIIRLFEGKKVYIVSGKHFGLLLESNLQNEDVTIFMTPEEYEEFLIGK